MHEILALSGLMLIAVSINLPLGYLRGNYNKFSFGWFFYVHISIPVIMLLRMRSGFSWKFIPLTLMAVVTGQMIGGILRKRVLERQWVQPQVLESEDVP
jgi:hypothetical protein